MDIEFSHIIVIVAVVIAAIRGLLEKRQAARQERELLDDVNERVAERQQRQHQEEPRPEPPPMRRQQTGSFQDLYEEFRKEILDRQQTPTPVPVPVPPPLPAAPEPPQQPAKKIVTPSLTAAEEAALQRVQQAGPSALVATPLHTRRRQENRLFKNRSDLRRAFILKEVLDPPKALQPAPQSVAGALH